MSNEITMPKLSDTMEEGKIIRWLKRTGDPVRRGEPLAEVETDKADMVLEAFDDGVLGEIKLKEGESAPVGAVIALMSDAAGASTSGSGPKPAPPAQVSSAQPRPEAAASEGAAGSAAPEGEGAATAEPEEGPEFHPAMSASPGAAPTAIAKPPRLVAVKTQPQAQAAAHDGPGCGPRRWPAAPPRRPVSTSRRCAAPVPKDASPSATSTTLCVSSSCSACAGWSRPTRARPARTKSCRGCARPSRTGWPRPSVRFRTSM